MKKPINKPAAVQAVEAPVAAQAVADQPAADVSNKVISLAQMMSRKVEANEGPFTYVVVGLPSQDGAPNLNAILLSRATGAPVEVRNAKGQTLATANFVELEMKQREALLLRTGAFGGKRGQRASTAASSEQENAARDLMRRAEGADRSEVHKVMGKAMNVMGLAKKLAVAGGFNLTRDKNLNPPRFWLWLQAEGHPLARNLSTPAVQGATVAAVKLAAPVTKPLHPAIPMAHPKPVAPAIAKAAAPVAAPKPAAAAARVTVQRKR